MCASVFAPDQVQIRSLQTTRKRKIGGDHINFIIYNLNDIRDNSFYFRLVFEFSKIVIFGYLWVLPMFSSNKRKFCRILQISMII